MTTHGPPSTSRTTVRSPWSTAVSRTRALSTSLMLAFQAIASVLCPLNVSLNVPPVTVPVREIVTISSSPSARSSVALVPVPTRVARGPASTAVFTPPPPMSVSRPRPPVRRSSPPPPFSRSSPSPPSSVTGPSVKPDASSVFALTPPASVARSIPASVATSPEAYAELRVGQRHVRVALGDDPVEAEAAGEGVVAPAADERVVAAPAGQRVVIEPAVEAQGPVDDRRAGDLLGHPGGRDAEVVSRERAVHRDQR